jgi:hypothetical protein
VHAFSVAIIIHSIFLLHIKWYSTFSGRKELAIAKCLILGYMKILSNVYNLQGLERRRRQESCHMFAAILSENGVKNKKTKENSNYIQKLERNILKFSQE